MMNFKKFFSYYILWILILIGITHGEKINFTGYVRSELSLILQSNLDYSMVQNTFSLNIEKSGLKASFFVNPYINHTLELNKPDIGVRQIYLDLYFKYADFRIGKQQIIWGKANSVFITDVVSPKNMSSFLLPDFEEIRIGVTGIKSDVYIGKSTLEFIWLPFFTPNVTPASNSIWYNSPAFPVSPNFQNSGDAQDLTLKNSELFFKFGVISSFIDLDLMGGYMYDDEPALHISKKINPSNKQIKTIDIKREHHRLPTAGFAFSTDIEKVFLLRGEAGYFFKKYFLPEKPLFQEIVQKDYIHYLIGIEKTIREVNFNLQFIQKIIVDYNEYIKNKEIENSATVLINRKFLRETLLIELLTYIGFNDPDFMLKPKIEYSIIDSLSVQLGGCIFWGSDDSTFGRYDKNDLIYTKIKYNF